MRLVMLGLAVLSAAAAASLLVRGSARGRAVTQRTSPRVAGPDGREDRAEVGAERSVLARLRPPLALLAGVGGWAFLGGVVGLVAGLVALVIAWVVLGRTESPAARRRRELLARDLPTGVDLLAGCLRAGGAVPASLEAVAAALPGPLAEEFGALRHRLELGVDPATVWRELAGHPQLGPMGRALARAQETGSSVSGAVERLAGELRAAAASEIEQRARSVDVKASVPLGLCFLPAFLVVAVVPLVAGIFGSMSMFG